MSTASALRKAQDVPFDWPFLSNGHTAPQAVVEDTRPVSVFSGSLNVVSREGVGGWTVTLGSSGIEQPKHVFDAAEFTFLVHLYEMEDHFSVKDYISRFPFTAKLLLEAHPRLVSRFGVDNRVLLQLVEDADSPGSLELFGIVRTRLEPAKALELLRSFDEEWWFNAAKEANGRLNFDVEYA